MRKAMRKAEFYSAIFKNNYFKNRTKISIIVFFLSLWLFFLILRLFYIAIFINDPKIAKRYSNYDRNFVKRGDILDRNGVILATTIETSSLNINRNLIESDDHARDVAQKIAKTLNIKNWNGIYNKISKSNTDWIEILRDITPVQQHQIKKLALPPVYFQSYETRNYIHNSLFSHLLGYARFEPKNDSLEFIGMSGLELQYNEILNQNKNITTSFDTRIQSIIYDELIDAKEKFDFNFAIAILIDVKNSEVISMVNLPDFNPNNYENEKQENFFNGAVNGVYEIGSVFKIFNTAMALEYGIVSENKIYSVKEPLRYGSHEIDDMKHTFDEMSVADILRYSSNIGSAKIALDAGITNQKKFLKELNLLNGLKINFPSNAKPLFPSKWSEVNSVTISYGYGISVTPLQLINAVASVVNGGEFHTPRFVLENLDASGEKYESRRVMSKDTSNVMRRLLRNVVAEGTGRGANIVRYDVGGKTGTAKAMHNGRYVENQALVSFVGVFPMRNPKYAILVMVNKDIDSSGVYATGGGVSAPIVGNIIRKSAPILNVFPDHGEGIDGKKS